MREYYKTIRALEQDTMMGDEEIQVGDNITLQLSEEGADSLETLAFEVTEVLPEGFRVTLIDNPIEVTSIDYGDEYPELVTHSHIVEILE